MPLFLVFDALSDPARSIRFSLAIVTSLSLLLGFLSKDIIKTACDRDDASLAHVASLVLFLFPILMISLL